MSKLFVDISLSYIRYFEKMTEIIRIEKSAFQMRKISKNYICSAFVMDNIEQIATQKTMLSQNKPFL